MDDDLGFLSLATSDATAALMVLLPDGTVTHIRDVSPITILDKCPLLYHALEFGSHSFRQASIEATSRAAIVSLLRYLYTGDYLTAGQPSSLLIHAEAFKIGEDFDVPELQVSAYVNFTRETEFSCCVATPPADLCETVQFLYKYLASQQHHQQKSLVDTLLNYCLGTFTYQGLGERPDFRQLVFDLPDFHKDLCRVNMQRDFQDEGALDIVRMPVCRPTPHSRDHLNKRALGDFQFDFWKDSEDPVSERDDTPETSPAKRRKSDIDDCFTLVHRPKDASGPPVFSDSDYSESEYSGDELDFALVHRPKLEIDPVVKNEPPSSYPSSPELILTPPMMDPEVKTEDYDSLGVSEDEWSLV